MLVHSVLREVGEGVKAINENRLTRARAYAHTIIGVSRMGVMQPSWLCIPLK